VQSAANKYHWLCPSYKEATIPHGSTQVGVQQYRVKKRRVVKYGIRTKKLDKKFVFGDIFPNYLHFTHSSEVGKRYE
jgi:hypothetical protein